MQFAVSQRGDLFKQVRNVGTFLFKAPAGDAPLLRRRTQQEPEIFDERFGATPVLKRQMEAVAQKLQLTRRNPTSMMRLPLKRPVFQCGLISLLCVPMSFGLREHRQCAERNIVRLKLAVRIAQDAGDFVAEFERAPGIRAEVNAAKVVVVGVEVVPEERLAPQNSLQLANRFRRDGLRDYFRSGPENPDGRVQELSQLFQVIGMPDRT